MTKFILILITFVFVSACGASAPQAGTLPSVQTQTRRHVTRTFDRATRLCLAGHDEHCPPEQRVASRDATPEPAPRQTAPQTRPPTPAPAPSWAMQSGPMAPPVTRGRPLMVQLPPGAMSETRMEARGTAEARGIPRHTALMRRMHISTRRPFSLAIVVPGFGPSFMDGPGATPHSVVMPGGNLMTIPVFHDTQWGEIFFDSPGRREFRIVYYRMNSDGVLFPLQSCSFSRPAEGDMPMELTDSMCR